MEDAGVNQTSMRDIQRQIADQVPAGRFSTSDIRAATIARTEVKYAQNVSSLEAYQASEDIQAVTVIDAQIGPTDAGMRGPERHGCYVRRSAAPLADIGTPQRHTRSFAPVVRRPPPEA